MHRHRSGQTIKKHYQQEYTSGSIVRYTEPMSGQEMDGVVMSFNDQMDTYDISRRGDKPSIDIVPGDSILRFLGIEKGRKGW